MNADNLDIRLLRYRSRRDEPPHALASSLLEAGRAQEALEVVRLASAESAPDARLLLLEGRAWFEQAALPEAQDALMRAAKADPRDKEPYRWLAQVLMKRGEPGRAVQVLERALRLDATDKTLQQAHMRAQRLARIANDTELSSDNPVEPAGPVVSTRPLVPRASTERPQPVEPARPAAPKVVLAKPKAAPKQIPDDVRFLLDREPDNTPAPHLRSSSEPRLPAVVTPDPVDDAPTAAFEMPAEIRNWLEAERASDMATMPPAPSEAIPSPVLELGKPRGSESGAQPDFASDFDSALARDDEETIQKAGPQAPPSEAEPPEQVLEMLAQQGVFETKPTAGVEWAKKGEAPRAGNRVGKTLAVTWLLALMAAGGGYYGWTQWLGARRADARALIADAVAAAHDGEHASLVSAERLLREARALDPKSSEAVEQLLFVHATRALEDASGDVGYLRNTLARAEAAGTLPALVAATKALLAAADRDAPSARKHATHALEVGAGDARVLYLVGRLYQRSGSPEARGLLQRASAKDPTLALAWSAEAELALADEEVEQGRALLEKALGEDKKFLRAELWRIVLDTSAESAPTLKPKLDALSERIRAGSASDQLLAMIARARLARESGQPDAARAALEGAQKLTVLDPELMSLLAQEAFALGLNDLAYRAANAALTVAPSVQRYRESLISALLARGDGRAATRALARFEAAEGDTWLMLSMARAALLMGSREALADAKKSLAAYRATPAGRQDGTASALLLRADLKLGANAESLLPSARTLVQQRPESADALLALGEAALNAGQGELARSTLERATKAHPGNADVHYLMGRVMRLLGQPESAKRELEQALALAAGHELARAALGGLLLDSGDYAAASEVFGKLERDGSGVTASLGSIESLLGSGEMARAEARLNQLSEAERALPAAKLLLARVAIANGKSSQALALLEPLVAKDSETRTAETLSAYGEALYANDKVDSAAGAFEAALELDPTLPDALIGRAMAAVRAEKTKDAKGYLEGAQKSLLTRVRPPRMKALLLVTWAKAHLIDKEYDPAKQKLLEAVTLNGAPTETHFWLGESLSKTKSQGASESYARYLDLDPNGAYAARARRALAPR